MTVLRWEKPPKERPRGNWQRTACVLAERRGEWALILDAEVPEYAYRVSTTLKRLGCEVVTQSGADRRSEGRVSLWARVV